jgi:hypothetical protein
MGIAVVRALPLRSQEIHLTGCGVCGRTLCNATMLAKHWGLASMGGSGGKAPLGNYRASVKTIDTINTIDTTNTIATIATIATIIAIMAIKTIDTITTID